MKPFFPYIGSKWTLAPRYGAPRFATTIEPFAGSAAYSVRHDAPRAILFDAFPKIVTLWRYLIAATSEEILRLPVDFDQVSTLDIPDGAKYLIGFWIGKGGAEPKNTRSAWARQYRHSGDCKVWGEAARSRVASQVDKIKDWEARVGDFTDAPDTEATWFVDPPYEVRGKFCYSKWRVDTASLAEFCRSRCGQVIVCEGEQASWLPFEHFADGRGTFGKHRSSKSPEFAWFSDTATLSLADLV